MRVATWNVNGVRKRWEELCAWVAQERPDVLCLQEIKAAPEQVPEPLLGLPEHASYWHGARGGYSGVSLHVRREAFGSEPAFGHPSFDRECRIVEAALGDLVVASVYVPNGRRDFEAKLRFLEALREHAARLVGAGREVLICGDLNVTREPRDVHEKERNAAAVGQRADERARLEALLDEGLVDVGRALAPTDDGLFTWWAPWRSHRGRNIGWRLDYVLATAGLAARARHGRVLRETGTSDHGPVVIDFESNPEWNSPMHV
ncbi:MAG: exodeoxyribonuclease III [Myxococcota bacterium]